MNSEEETRSSCASFVLGFIVGAILIALYATMMFSMK